MINLTSDVKPPHRRSTRSSLLRRIRSTGLLVGAAGAALSVGVAAPLLISAANAATLPAGTTSLWDLAATPKVTDDGDTASAELGTKFKPSVNGYATGVAFYKNARNTGTHTGSLWTAAGTRLATVRFSGETTKGWQTAKFAKPVALSAGKTYVISYHAPRGHYADDTRYFTKPHKHRALIAKAGVYKYSRTKAFPTKTWKSSNYYVDVLFHRARQGSAASSPSPTATPSARATSSTGWPSPSTSGVPTGTTLKVVNSGVSANTAGQVIDGLEVHGDISVNANNVTIKNSRVFGRINVGYTHSGTLIQDVEVDHMAGPTSEPAIGDAGFTCIRCYVHSVGPGIRVENNASVRDSYVYIARTAGDVNHKTAVSGHGGAHIVLTHNNLVCADDYCSAAFSLYGDFAQIDDVLAQNNLFNTTGGYCTYGGSVASKPYPHATNVRYLDNHFGRVYSSKCGEYGPVASWENNTGNVWSGNVWDDTGQTLTP